MSVKHNVIERTALPYMRDERDLIFIRVAVSVTAVVPSLALILFLLPPMWVGLLAVPYIGFVFLNFGGRYGLMLHATGHRPMFKREYSQLNHYIPFALGPFLGHTPTSFAAHHMWMHHAENNMLGDGSSTLPYRRDHFPHFLHYWFRFFAFGHIHLLRYLVLRGRTKTAVRFVLGELYWIALASVALWLNWAAALVVFVIPLVMMRWLMMAGNWSQHAFVDIDNPDCGMRNSTCLTNTNYNRKCYNDGYHIVHHMKPAMHWSEMPAYHEANLEHFSENDCLVFDGIADNQHIWFLLMFHRYETLADHMVDLRPRTHEEKIAYLKRRVRTQLGTIPSIVRLETSAQMAETHRRNALPAAQALMVE